MEIGLRFAALAAFQRRIAIRVLAEIRKPVKWLVFLDDAFCILNLGFFCVTR